MKVVKCLLDNQKYWFGSADRDHQKGCPILVICYTNHALDQFLEGIVSIMPEKVVRIGSRSKSEILQPYNLSGMRAEWGGKRKFSNETARMRNRYNAEYKELENQIEHISEGIQWGDAHVLSERRLQGVVPDKFLMGIKINLINEFGYDPDQYLGKEKSSMLREWLCVGPLRCVAVPNFANDNSSDEQRPQNGENVPEESDDEMEQETQERQTHEDNADSKRRRDNKKKFDVSQKDIDHFNMLQSNFSNGWQIQKPFKLLKKLQNEAKKQIRLVEPEAATRVNIFIVLYYIIVLLNF